MGDLERQRVDEIPLVTAHDVQFPLHADLIRDPPGGDIVRSYEAYDPGQVKGKQGEIPYGPIAA